MKYLVRHALMINEGKTMPCSVIWENGIITHISNDPDFLCDDAEVHDAEGAYLLPGVIDDHVHMREPGLTHKANMDSETCAAAAGGVTSVMDMPNVVPQTTTIPLWEEREETARHSCHVNYAFFLGATDSNMEEIRHVDITRVPGIKLFMGSSTGNMLVDKEERLRDIFRNCPTLLMTHCEDTVRINMRMEEAIKQYGDDPDITHHAEIRDEEACFLSSSLAVKLAQEFGTQLHIAHITTARELELLDRLHPNISGEACVAHLIFTDEDYRTLGTRIKCNPSIKSAKDRDALRKALSDGTLKIVATDHAPHLLKEKEGGCRKAMSGMPMIQFSLPAMLSLTDQGVLTKERVVELMCHAPADLFNVDRRGYIREGYYADLTLVKHTPMTVTKKKIQSLCGWSPLEDTTLNWTVAHTWVNGQTVWDGKRTYKSVLGMPLRFRMKQEETRK